MRRAELAEGAPIMHAIMLDGLTQGGVHHLGFVGSWAQHNNSTHIARTSRSVIVRVIGSQPAAHNVPPLLWAVRVFDATGSKS